MYTLKQKEKIMELMLLVYAVENLSYNGTFFGTLAFYLTLLTALLFTVKGMVYFYNQNQKTIKEITKTKVTLSKGDTFQLKKDYFSFRKDKIYQISSVYNRCDTIYYYEIDEEGNTSAHMKSCEGRKRIERLLSEQQGEKVKVTEAKNINLPNFPMKILITLVVVFSVLNTVLPQRQTAIYMVGAYAAQEVLTADKTQELGNKTYLAISNQLDKWAEEVPELKGLIEDSVTEKVKEELIK